MKNNTPTLSAGWEISSVKAVSSSIQYGFTGKKVAKSKWKYLRITDIQNGEVDWENVPFSDVSNKDSKKYILEKGDILFARSGATAGKSYLFDDKDIQSIFASYLIRVISNDKKIIPEFLYNFFQSDSYWQQIQASIIGTAQPNVNGQKLGNVKIPLPPLETQKKIVAKITKLQKSLGEALASLKKAEKRLESVMASALHKLIPNDETELPEGWEMVELQEVAEINPKKSEIREVSDGTEITFVPMAAVSEYTGTIESPEIKKLGKVRKGYTYFAEGDVLFAKITPCMENGKSAIARNLKNGIGFGTTEFHVIRPSKRLKAEFIYAILRSTTFRYIAQQNMTGTAGQARVPTDFMKEYRFAIPPLAEQAKIIARLAQIKEQVNVARSLYAEALARTEKIQQSLLQKAFRGELVLETAPAKEEKIDWFKLKQVIGAIIKNLGTNASLRGEMVLAKYTFFVQELFGVHTGLQFQKHNFGPYSPAIKKAILASSFNKDKFFKVQGKGVQQVYALGQNSDKLFKYQNTELTQTESAMNTLSEAIGNLPSDKVELLATICKIIQDSGSTDSETVWQEMQNWKTEGRNGESKADIFDKDSTLRCLEFVKSKKWDIRLLK